jgi:hypothetical protein
MTPVVFNNKTQSDLARFWSLEEKKSPTASSKTVFDEKIN